MVAGLLAGLVAAVLAGCGADGDDGNDPSPGTPSPTSHATASTPPSGQSPSPSGRPPSVPGRSGTPPTVVPPGSPGPTQPGAEQQTLTGRVVAGVEPRCLVLETAQGQYLLLGGEEVDALPVGTTVTVRGQARTDLATTCQQGTPFEVSEIVD